MNIHPGSATPLTEVAVPAPRVGQQPDLVPTLPAGFGWRSIPVGDVVTFTSACPGCGSEATWTESREDTRLVVSIDCACG